jgi:YesN/AraC family two-component response regulator
LGIKQKPINPSFDLSEEQETAEQLSEISSSAENKVLQNLIQQFEQNKLYLNDDLTIMDVVQVVGTNRTYLSALINQRYKQNFCSYVNSFRIKALKELTISNPTCAYEILAESCGFGSVSSMKRAVSSSTGLSISEWKKTLITQ